MGYRLNRLDETVFMTVSKPLLTEFGIHHRLESCEVNQNMFVLLLLVLELFSPVVLRGRVFEGVIGRSKCLFFISSSGDPQVPCQPVIVRTVRVCGRLREEKLRVL